MARTLFPHHRHVNFDAGLYKALAQAAEWHRCTMSAYIRGAVEGAARAEYVVRGLPFPVDFVEALPGQGTMFPPSPPASPIHPDYQGEPPPPGRTAQRVADPADQAAVRSFLLAKTGFTPSAALARAIDTMEGEESE